MIKNYKQKKLLITGGANGLGKEIVVHFAPLMKEVIFIDKSIKEGKSLEKNLNKKGYNVKFYFCDLSNLKNSSKTFSTIFKKHHAISFLINNAKDNNKSDFKEETLKSWIKTINIVLNSSFMLIQKFIKQKKNVTELKSIINITSLLVDLIDHKPPSYQVSKTGLSKLTEYYAVQAAENCNFRINNISPGHLIQKRHLGRFNKKNNSIYKKQYLSSTPLKTHLTENDIIETIEFLFSDSSNYYNGETFKLHGGASLMANTMSLKKSKK